MANALNSGSSAESKAFRKCSSDLLRGIQDPELLAWELYSEDVVSETVVDEVGLLGLSAVQRKARLLSAVRNQIAVDPSKFQSLLLALKKQPPLVNVAEKLETIFKTCGTYHRPSPRALLRFVSGVGGAGGREGPLPPSGLPYPPTPQKGLGAKLVPSFVGSQRPFPPPVF